LFFRSSVDNFCSFSIGYGVLLTHRNEKLETPTETSHTLREHSSTGRIYLLL